MRWGVLALGWACVSGLAPAAPAQGVAGTVHDSRWRRVEDAPRSRWRPAGEAGAWQPGGPASGMQGAAAPSSVFRAAEVPAARLDRTRELLGALEARQDERQAIVVELPADVLFDFDQSKLRADARESLDRAAELLRSYPGAPVRVVGHTDAKGTDAYNDALSLRRARAVAQQLQAGGGRTLKVEGSGRHAPVAPNTQGDGSDDPEGRARNRRVEIVIETPGPAPAGRS